MRCSSALHVLGTSAALCLGLAQAYSIATAQYRHRDVRAPDDNRQTTTMHSSIISYPCWCCRCWSPTAYSTGRQPAYFAAELRHISALEVFFKIIIMRYINSRFTLLTLLYPEAAPLSTACGRGRWQHAAKTDHKPETKSTTYASQLSVTAVGGLFRSCVFHLLCGVAVAELRARMLP